MNNSEVFKISQKFCAIPTAFGNYHTKSWRAKQKGIEKRKSFASNNSTYNVSPSKLNLNLEQFRQIIETLIKPK